MFFYFINWCFSYIFIIVITKLLNKFVFGLLKRMTKKNPDRVLNFPIVRRRYLVPAIQFALSSVTLLMI